MRDFLSLFISQVFADFQTELGSRTYLCELRELNFNGGRAPDYSSILLQQLFLLRYFPAYLVEYYIAWRDLLWECFLPKQLNLLSIGAGNGADYTALRYAIRDAASGSCITYHGVDKEKWAYQDKGDPTQCRYIHSDVGIWTGFRNCHYNVIVFPKSLGELSESAFQTLLAALSRSQYTSDRICLLSSLRKAPQTANERYDHHNELMIREDKERLEQLALVFTERQGFARLTEPCTSTTIIDPNIASAISFYYPDKPYNMLGNLAHSCPAFAHCASCSLSRCPMLNIQGLEYQIVMLAK